jgi:hypothetical protein
MYRVCKGKYINNVKVGELIKTFYEGEILPGDYVPPEDYISPNGIVEKIEREERKEKKKTEAING